MWQNGESIVGISVKGKTADWVLANHRAQIDKERKGAPLLNEMSFEDVVTVYSGVKPLA